MKSLIVTGNESSAGCLKAAHRADATLGLWPRLLIGPPPDTEAVLRIFAPREFESDEDSLLRRGPILRQGDRHLLQSGNGIKSLFNSFDKVELWFDPDAESQLALMLLLSYLRDEPPISDKVSLVHLDCRLADLRPEMAAALLPHSEPVTDVHLETASRIWRAWKKPDPEDFSRLLYEDLSSFLAMKRIAPQILGELPGLKSGLNASETIMLELIADGGATTRNVLSRYLQELWPGTYDGTDAVQLLVGLGHAAEPAIVGLPLTKGQAYSQDELTAVVSTYSPLRLTELGQRLLDGSTDLAKAGPAVQWWGGTRLTSERQWRWDAASRKLHHLVD